MKGGKTCQTEIPACSKVEKLDHQGIDCKLFSRAKLRGVGWTRKQTRDKVREMSRGR